MSLIKDYFEKTKKHITEFGELTIVLMQVGAFFEVYGLKDKNDSIYESRIMDFSRICDLNVVEKKVYMPIVPMIIVNGISAGIGTGWSCNIPSYNIEDFL
jgi:hypothetical protein